MSEWRQSEGYAQWRDAYLARPDVKARRSQSDRKRAQKRKAQQKAYRKTARAKLMHCRRQARIRLTQATSEKRREAIRALIAAYSREIDRIARDRSR
jgi:hypothetical protein